MLCFFFKRLAKRGYFDEISFIPILVIEMQLLQSLREAYINVNFKRSFLSGGRIGRYQIFTENCFPVFPHKKFRNCIELHSFVLNLMK